MKREECEKEERKYLPKEWNDSETIRFRFAEFRAKNVNPDGWEIKMRFWFNCIENWSTLTKRYKFKIDDIREAFVKGNSIRPQINCLKLVLSNMLRKRMIQTYADFESTISSQSKGESWISWGLNSLVSKPLAFGWSLLSSAEEDEGEDLSEKQEPQVTENTYFICFNAVKNGAQLLFNRFTSSASSNECYKYEYVEKVAKDELEMDDSSLEVVIMFLQSKKKVKILEESGMKLIKFGENPAFDELEISRLRLECAKDLIEKEIRNCEDEMELCKEEARQCVRENNKIKAKSLLRRKKRLENLISKKETQMDNISYLSEQLLNSNSHKVVIQAYQKSVEALKQAQISHESIDNTMLDFEDIIQQQEAVSQIGKALGDIVGAVDDKDVEHELELLLEESEEKPERSNVSSKDDDELNALLQRLDNLKKPITEEPGDTKVRSKTASQLAK